GELQALLRAVRPQVAVHARVHGLAVLVQAGAPGVVPHSPEIGLLLEADDFRDFGTRAAGGIEGAKLGQAAGAGAEYGDTLGHVVCHLLSGARPTGAYPRAKSAKHRPGMETTPTGVRRPALRATRGGPREKSWNAGWRPPGARRMPDMDTGRGTPSTARARSSKQTRSSVICTKCRAIITRTRPRSRLQPAFETPCGTCPVVTCMRAESMLCNESSKKMSAPNTSRNGPLARPPRNSASSRRTPHSRSVRITRSCAG